MLRWYPSALLRVVLGLTFVPISFVSVFAVMCVFDPDTPWRGGPWSGPGSSGDFWKVAALLAVGWTLLTLGWRGAKVTFKALLLVWHVGWTAVLVAQLAESESLVLRGEAMSFRISISALGPAFSVSALACAIVWVRLDAQRGTRDRSVSPLQRRNKVAGLVAVITLAAAGLAFHLDYDEIGCLAGVVGGIACQEVMRPLNPSEELRRAFQLEGSAPR